MSSVTLIEPGPPEPSVELKIGMVTSRFNSQITEGMENAALKVLDQKGIRVFLVRVPGAVEIPLAAQSLFEKRRCDGVVVLGCVIRGQTQHFDYVCRAVERGCSELQLRWGRPLGFGVLTTENRQQALERAGGEKGNKGREAALVTLEMIQLLKSLKTHEGDSKPLPEEEKF